MAINQYVRDRNGENDYKKGNRNPKQPQQGETLAIVNRLHSESVAHYKEAVNKLRKAKRRKQEDVYAFYKNIQEYIERTTEADKPLTVAGIILASGVSKATWYEIAGGDYDYQLLQVIDIYNIDVNNISDYIDNIPVYYIDGNKENTNNNVIMLIMWSEITQKAMLAIEEQTETRLYEKGRVGEIFALKSLHNWKEDATPQTVNQTLVIASPEQAKKAIELLK